MLGFSLFCGQNPLDGKIPYLNHFNTLYTIAIALRLGARVVSAEKSCISKASSWRKLCLPASGDSNPRRKQIR